MATQKKEKRKGFKEAPPVVTVFEKYQPGQWRATRDGTRYAFPVLRIVENGGNRIVPRARPYRDGAKLDDTGSKEKTWELTVDFDNSIVEPGVEQINGKLALYPGVLNAMIDSCDLNHEAPGDLAVPTRGWIRARLGPYRREEDFSERDCARVTFTFIEDNEDRVDARSFAAPTASANSRRLAVRTTFDAQSDGIWNDDTQSLEAFASQLEAVANAPGDTAAEVDQKAGSTIGSVNRIFKAFSDPSREGRDKLSDPESSSTTRKLHHTKEIAARARMESRRGRPQLVSLVFERQQSLVSIAAMLGQDFDDLLMANPRLDDPMYIPPGTPVKVYASEQAA